MHIYFLQVPDNAREHVCNKGSLGKSGRLLCAQGKF